MNLILEKQGGLVKWMSKNQNAGSSNEMNFCGFIGLKSYQDSRLH